VAKLDVAAFCVRDAAFRSEIARTFCNDSSSCPTNFAMLKARQFCTASVDFYSALGRMVFHHWPLSKALSNGSGRGIIKEAT
jgi:hypothetical protein